ncbi:peptide MFS transporter [Legionella sp. 227]|uniref:peptide MFS transporter n=1 Tax=Legionella sp. 227 TaxID=3367288 RepID=UPI00370D1BDA
MFSLRKKGISLNLLHLISGIVTFSYAVLFSSLVLYLTRGLGYTKNEANSFIGMFLAFNFALHLVAGYLGGRIISNRILLIISTFFQVIGTYILSFSTSTGLMYGLSLFLIGCGINSTSLKCILTQKIENDANREISFFINYSAINAGFLSGFFVGGYYEFCSNYTRLFNICNIFNVLAVILIICNWRSYECGMEQRIVSFFKQITLALGIMSILCLLIIIGFSYAYYSNSLVVVLGIFTLLFLIHQIKITKIITEKRNIYAFILLSLSSIIFWTLFYIGPMGITYFLKENIKAQIFRVVIPPQWYMNLNSIFVIIFSPLLGYFFQKLKKWGLDLSLSHKFIIAITFIGISFFVFSLGIINSDDSGFVSPSWVALHFILQAFGEVFIAPVGYSMVGVLAPQRLQGIMMGFWMMVSGIAASLANFLSNSIHYEIQLDPLSSNPNYLSFFDKLGVSALFFATIMFFFSRRIDNLVAKNYENDCSCQDNS